MRRQKTHPRTPREVELKEQLAQCQEALAAAQRENVLLRQKLDALARRFFGVSSGSLNPAQLQLLLSLPELSAQPTATAAPAVAPERAPKPARRSRAPRRPEHLPPLPLREPSQNQGLRCFTDEFFRRLVRRLPHLPEASLHSWGTTFHMDS